MKYFVYILKSRKNGKNYAGFTRKSVVERMREHNHGSNTWTRKKGPFDLLHVEEFSSRKAALKREKYYKSAAGRKHLKKLFPGSSMVEHSAVNRRVAGSSPARGAFF